MGHHYTPRKHLQRFKIEGGKNLVWMYDKTTRKFSPAGIGGVASEPEYYEEGIEKGLAQDIEGPSNPVIQKIFDRKQLNNEERRRLTLYMLTMATRGPRQRRKSYANVPTALKEVTVEVRATIQAWADENADDAELQLSRLKELDELEQKYETEIPDHVDKLIRVPFFSDQTLELLHNMFWHIIPAPPGTFFVTADTPAHFFDGLGLGKPNSEFTFPISKDIALIGEHQRSHGLAYEKPDAQIVKEVNRRILSVVERFVFSPRNEAWIDTVCQKTDPYLSTILWK